MASLAAIIRHSANFRFKQRYGRYFLYSVIASFFAHVAFNLYFPNLSAGFQVREETTMEAMDLPPEVVIPPPPKPLAKPSVPMEAPEELDEDITIEETTPPPPDLIPEVPVQEIKEDAQEFLMVAEVVAKPKYMPPKPKMPPYIARARVDVETVIRFFVDEKGNVDPNRTRIHTSSGYPDLDEIAVVWAKQIKFHPALNRGEPVKMQMAIPIKWLSK